MRSEPVNPVQGRAERREGGEPAPAAKAVDSFEAALQRRGRRGPFDDEAGLPQTPLPETPAPTFAGLPPLQPRAEALPTPAMAQPVATPDALARQLRAQALPDSAVEPGRWQLQITETGLPVQRLELQRTAAAAPFTVLVSANLDAQQPRHATRLRERLQARGAARVDFRGPPTEQES